MQEGLRGPATGTKPKALPFPFPCPPHLSLTPQSLGLIRCRRWRRMTDCSSAFTPRQRLASPLGSDFPPRQGPRLLAMNEQQSAGHLSFDDACCRLPPRPASACPASCLLPLPLPMCLLPLLDVSHCRLRSPPSRSTLIQSAVPSWLTAPCYASLSQHVFAQFSCAHSLAHAVSSDSPPLRAPHLALIAHWAHAAGELSAHASIYLSSLSMH